MKAGPAERAASLRARRLAGSPGLARLALATLLAACSPTSGDEPLCALLITLDTTRADALSCYGNPRARTPALDRLAAEGVLFERAHSVTALTLPAHASMLTGLDPLRHGLRDNGVAPLPASARTVAEAARAAGVETAAFVSSVVLAASFGLDQGFDTYDVPARRGPASERLHGAERPARETLAAARSWLRQRDAKRPFFLWIHLYDPHHPYAPPAPFDQQFPGEPYLGEVAAMDAELGRFLDELAAVGTLEHTFVLALADHGEAFGEHGEVTHGSFCYETTLHVPLIARWPRSAPGAQGRVAGTRSQELVGVVDVAPTLVEALGLPALEDVDGLSFFRRQLPAERGLYLESYYGYLAYGWSPLVGWIDARGKYLHGSPPEFYDWIADPLETRDLAPERAGELEPYRAAIEALTRRSVLTPEASQVPRGADGETLAAIQSLGYAGAGEDAGELPGPLEPSSLPSPRSQAGFLERVARAQDRVLAGEDEEAATIYEQVLRDQPGNFFALDELAGIRLRQGRTEEAVQLLERVAREGPQRGRAWFSLGVAQRAAGRLQDAVESFQRAVELSGGRPRYQAALDDTRRALKAH